MKANGMIANESFLKEAKCCTCICLALVFGVSFFMAYPKFVIGTPILLGGMYLCAIGAGLGIEKDYRWLFLCIPSALIIKFSLDYMF